MKNDLHEALLQDGSIDFASLVRSAYNCKKMNDKSVNYRSLLELTGDQAKLFKSLLEGPNAAPRYDPEDWRGL